ncbi:hypothetical protein G3A49_16820 [Haloferax volcanii]|nr:MULTISPECIES: hypothetical protein [Haloferax]ELK56028.1 hypothetical protein D320_01463 [Haloferax sp. BAB-2207]ELZ76786.1 hypothetical protein C456_03846 [Haloferax lucentense DSM 14919]NLV04236.1 hypothetical protein [Haloferax alexandrinus]QIB79671.1 hypothetical protein G3A49_16820 [Haloferax alexandrinus]TVT95121.1 hypothetical protein FQA18_08225 [Haloferax volcanii]
MFQKRRNAAGLFVLLFCVTVLTPPVFGSGYWYGLATFPGVFVLPIVVRRFERRFDVPLLIRRDQPNYWAGAASGLLTVFGTFLGVPLLRTTPLSQIPSFILCITVYGAILVFLFYGALLKDVEDGYLTVEPSE